MNFAAQIRAALPPALHLPDAFAQTFDCLEAQGHAGTITPTGKPFLSIYPEHQRDDPAASFVLFSFEGGPPLHAPPPEVMARVATLGQISGDGGTLSLWLDDDGKQWFVVFNHGEPHVLTDDPLIALQFLAIGYSEPGAITDPTLTATQQAAADMADPPVPPEAFRAFLAETFNVTVPDRASDLGITIPADGALDPIRDWLNTMMPEPEALPEPGSSPGYPFIITREFREALGEEGTQAIRDAFEYIVEEE